MSKSLNISINTQHFKPLYEIITLSFLLTFKSTCGANVVHERMKMWIYKYFMKDPAKAALKSLTTHKESNERMEGNLMIYCVMVSHFIKKHATEDIVGAVENNLFKLSQPYRM